MIKFFRHIRKSLLVQNKMGKYLKYAIGEIILVVIGILIALSINNWNETRKQQKQAFKYLYEFKKDLVSDTIQFKYMSKILTEEIEAEKQVLMVKNNTEANLENVIKALGTTTYQRTINRRTFLNVQNSGSSNLLGYENLFEKLSNYYVETNRDLALQTNYDAEQYRDNYAVFEKFISDGNYEMTLSYNDDDVADFLRQLNLDSLPILGTQYRNVSLDFVNTIKGRNVIIDNVARHLYIRGKYTKYYNEASQLLKEVNTILNNGND